MQNHNEQEIRQYAGFWMRFAAYLIDGIIVMIVGSVTDPVMRVLTVALEGTPLAGEILFRYTLTDIFEYIFIIAYFVIMTYFTGATLGKKLLKLKVVSVKGDGKLRLIDVIYRETIGRYLSDVFQGIGYLAVVFSDEKKAIHDMLCDTRVIEVRRKQVASVRTIVNPVVSPAANPVMQNEETQANNLAGNMVPQMVAEPPKQGQSSIEEQVQEQWKQILNPQTEMKNPPCEEQEIEGNS